MPSAHTHPGTLLKCPECGYVIPGESLSPSLRLSRFEELLSCNDPPLDSERIALEAVVREGKANLASLPLRIAAVRETLEILIEEQARTVKHVAEAESLLNPIRRLPADVLIGIFTACLSENTDSLDTKGVPWVLSQVCASWRQTSLASTAVWADVHLNMDLYKNHMEGVFRLGTVLDRAGRQSLEVMIEGCQDFSTHPIFAMILSTSARWKSLEVVAPLRSFRLFNSISYRLPLLETLTIAVYSFCLSDIHPPTCIYGFRKAPRLQKLTVIQQLVSHAPFISNLFVLPLESISELHLLSTASDVVSFLQFKGENHLVTCDIWLVHPEDRDALQRMEIPVITQAGIQNLTLNGSAVWLLPQFHLPGLQKLRLLNFEGPAIPVISEHTVPALKELMIIADVHGHALTDILQWTPNLSVIIFEIVIKDDTFFAALGRSREGVFELVPHLKILSLEGSRLEFSGHGQAITDMVEARRALPSGGGQAALQEVYLTDHLENSERWEKLREGGLIVLYETAV